jgi:DNA-binding MarR family transcriptional regulator
MAEKETVRAIEHALLRVIRNLGKRGLGRSKERKLEGLVDFSHLAVVDTLGQSDGRNDQVSVGQIARRVDLDHSRASRMVAAAIRAGYAKRTVSQDDGRRTCVALTEKGEEFAAAIGNLRRKFLAAQLKSWSDEECRQFAKLLSRFADGARHEAEDDASRLREQPPPTENVVVLHPKISRKARKRQRRKRA